MSTNAGYRPARWIPRWPRVHELADLTQDKITDGIADAVPSLAEKVLADLDATTTGLAHLDGLTWAFDPTLVRGMGYYTGQIFEVAHPDFPSSLAGGGRYDKLIGRSLGRDVPACGFSIGFERICDLLDTTVHHDTVAVLYDNDVEATRVLDAARRLRADGQRAVTIPRSGKLGAQLARLADWGFTTLIHLGAEDSPHTPPQQRTLGRGGQRLTPDTRGGCGSDVDRGVRHPQPTTPLRRSAARVGGRRYAARHGQPGAGFAAC